MDLFCVTFPKSSLIIGASTLIIIVTYCILRQIWTSSKGQEPPEAAGGWPLLGHLRLLTGPKSPHVTLAALADKYGPIFKIRIGIHPTVVISSWELAKECYTKHDESISSRPKLTAGKHIGYNYANVGFASYGPYWRDIRKIMTVNLLSHRGVEMFRHVRESETAVFMKELYNKVVRFVDSNQDYMQIEMKQWFGNLNMNMILRMIVGKGFNFESVITSDENEKASVVQKSIREFFYLAGLFVLADAVPFLEWLDVGGYERKMKKMAKEMDYIFAEWIEEHRQKRNSNRDAAKGNHQDFMDVLLSVLDDFKNPDFDADTVNKATAMALLAGGTDSTIVTLIWALSLLLNNPATLRKMQDELDSHVGRGRLVKESDIGELVYVQAVVNETFRLYPPGPFPGVRELMQDCNIGGYHVPAGYRLMVNLQKLQRDPRVWEDPDDFMPERFLTTHKNIDVKGQQHFKLLPFGGGRRVCPGIGHGMQIVLLILSSFVHAFDIKNLSSVPVDMTGTLGITNMKATPLEVLIKPRLSPSAYT